MGSDRKMDSKTDSKLTRPWLRQTALASTLIIHHPLHDTINISQPAEQPGRQIRWQFAKPRTALPPQKLVARVRRIPALWLAAGWRGVKDTCRKHVSAILASITLRRLSTLPAAPDRDVFRIWSSTSHTLATRWEVTKDVAQLAPFNAGDGSATIGL